MLWVRVGRWGGIGGGGRDGRDNLPFCLAGLYRTISAQSLVRKRWSNHVGKGPDQAQWLLLSCPAAWGSGLRWRVHIPSL